MAQFRPKKRRKMPASAAPAVRDRSELLSAIIGIRIRPEAELESRLATALVVAFPNIPRDRLVEQRRFTVRLGHETHLRRGRAVLSLSGAIPRQRGGAEYRTRPGRCWRRRRASLPRW